MFGLKKYDWVSDFALYKISSVCKQHGESAALVQMRAQTLARLSEMSSDNAGQQWIETYKSLVTLSIESLRFAALANGGAAVALLAYLGNVAGKGSTVPDMRCSMAAFLFGLGACGVALLFAYFTQFKLLHEITAADQKKEVVSHILFLWAAIILYAFSLAGFGLGSWLAVVRFHY